MDQLESRTTKLQNIIDHLQDFAATAHLDGQPRAEVGAVACLAQHARSLIDAIAADATTQAAAAGCPTSDGLTRIADYVALHTPAKPATIAQDHTIGLWLLNYPVFGAACRNGNLNRERIRLLKKCDNPRSRDALRRDQEFLAHAAQHCSFKDFQHVLAYWLAHNDEDGQAPEAQKQDRRGSLSKDAVTGVATGTFRLDAIASAKVDQALNQELHRLRRQDDADGTTRTHAQRVADAYTNLIIAGATRPDTTAPPPLCHIVLGIKTARELLLRHNHKPGDPKPSPGPVPVNAHDPDWRCELIDGTPLHPDAAYEALGQAALRRIVLEPQGDNPFSPAHIADLSQALPPQGDQLSARQLDLLIASTASVSLSSRQRTYPKHLKEALTVAARGRCANPGCNAKIHWLQADHIIPHSRGGPTHVRNGQMLCQMDNHIKRDHLPRPPLTVRAGRPGRQ